MRSDELQKPFRRRKDRSVRVLVAIALALLLHLLFFGALIVVAALFPEKPRPIKQSVTLRTIDAGQWQQNRGDAPPEESAQARAARQQKKPEEKKPEKHPKGQVVDVAPGNEEKPKDDAKYLAEHDNRVDKETRAREQTQFYKNAQPKRTTTHKTPALGHDAAEEAQSKGNNGLGHDERPAAMPQPRHGEMQVPDIHPRQEIALRTPQDGKGPGLKIPNQPQSDALHGNSDHFKVSPGTPGQGAQVDPSLGRLGNFGIANLMPSQAALDQIDGAAPNDHLDADQGDQTLLNTKEWKYAGFFNRVKQAVGVYWNPGEVLRQRDPTGNIYGGKDRYTVLTVTLTQRGMVKDIHVDKGSGIDFLDQEAIHAFHQAQPFPNPPAGLLAEDGLVHFQFGFFLEMSGMPRLQFFGHP